MDDKYANDRETPDSKYSQPNGVLKNNFNITNEEELGKKESMIAFMKSIDANFIEKLKIKDPFNSGTLKWIHKEIFGKTYEWAGKYRTVNISKERTMFFPYNKLDIGETSLYLNKPNDFASLMKMYAGLNHLHPFREGNGRATRIWLNISCDNILNKQINFSKISPEDYMNAMMSDNVTNMITLFESQLVATEDMSLDDHALNQAQSAKYEGYTLVGSVESMISDNKTKKS